MAGEAWSRISRVSLGRLGQSILEGTSLQAVRGLGAPLQQDYPRIHSPPPEMGKLYRRGLRRSEPGGAAASSPTPVAKTHL